MRMLKWLLAFLAVVLMAGVASAIPEEPLFPIFGCNVTNFVQAPDGKVYVEFSCAEGIRIYVPKDLADKNLRKSPPRPKGEVEL